MRYQGRITTWLDHKGYGFITPEDGGARVFVHIKAFGQTARRPQKGDPVSYTLDKDRQGRIRAESVNTSGTATRPRVKKKASKKAGGKLALLIAAGFLVGLAGAVWLLDAATVLLAIYAVLSVISFALYALDKNAAQTGRWRTKESTLHLLDLLGGWPGGLVAQQLFRHKIAKPTFQIVFWLTVVLNGMVLGWVLTPEGGQVLSDALYRLSQAVY